MSLSTINNSNPTAMKKSILTLLLMMAAMTSAMAYDFEYGGIYYNINGNEVSVTYKGSGYYYSNSYSGYVTIPESVTYNGETYAVTAIGDDAFFQCTYLTGVTIPNSVTSIGEFAFSHCTQLQNLEIPNSVTAMRK